MILFDTNTFVSHTFSKTNSTAKFLIALFNENTWQALHIIAIYKPSQMNSIFFISILKNIVTKIPTNCPIKIIRDFKINMLTNTIELKKIQKYMNTHGFHITSIENMTHNSTQINHIYGLMPQLNNFILDQHKLIGQIITLYTLHSNYLTIFLN